MKTLSKFVEDLHQVKEGIEQNQLSGVGVSNHYTPIDNIIINVRNLYGSLLGILVEKGEDGVSIKLKSSQFTSKQIMENILFRNLNGTSLYNYIQMQGLSGMKAIYTGQEYVAWFYPTDIMQAGSETMAACPEMGKTCCHESEMFNFAPMNESEEELEDKSHEELVEIIDGKDKIKAAQQFAEILNKRLSLPNDIYVKATKDSDGNESIALRYKYEKPRPFGKKQEMIVSLMNIYHSGHDAIWVDAFLNKEVWDDDIITLIQSILEIIGATETKDPCIWEIDTEVENPDENQEENPEEDPEENNEDSSSEESNNEEDDDKNEETK